MVTPQTRRKQILRWIRVWRDRLGVGDWKVEVEWDKKLGRNTHGYQVAARCYAQPKYRQASLEFSPVVNTAYQDKEGLEKLVLHELAHCVTEETLEAAFESSSNIKMSKEVRAQFESWVRQANEAETEALARALWKAYKK